MTEAQMGRWYMVNRDGMATLCVDREDAEKEAADAQSVWPHMGPHRAVQLVEAQATALAKPYCHEDCMAYTAGIEKELQDAQAAARPTPSHLEAMERAWLWMENQAEGQSKGGHATFDLMMLRDERDALRAAIDVAAPPTAQAEGWTRLPGQLPEPGNPVLLDIGKKYPIRALWAAKNTVRVGTDVDDCGEYDEETDEYYCPEGWYEWNEHEEVHWAVSETPRAWSELPQPLPAATGPADGESNE